jgi:hypothetical protein
MSYELHLVILSEAKNLDSSVAVLPQNAKNVWLPQNYKNRRLNLLNLQFRLEIILS